MTYDIEIRSQGCGYIVVRRNPTTRNRGAGGIGDDVGSVSHQNG